MKLTILFALFPLWFLGQNNINIETEILKRGKLLVKPELFSDEIKVVNEDTKILLTSFDDDYFHGCLDDGTCGYVSMVWIKPTDETKSLIKENQQRLDVINKEKFELLTQVNEAKLKAEEERYKKKFGLKTYTRLMNGEFWIGMTEEMAVISLGYPKKNNQTVGKWGSYEQWVYDDKYLYFENGKLVSFQR